MKALKLHLLFITICLLASCGTTQRQTTSKGEYLKKFAQFIETVKKEYPNYDDSDWARADKMFDQFTDREYDFYEGTYTTEEKEEIGRLRGAYTKIKLKKTAGRVKEGVKDAISSGKGLLKGLWE